MSDNPIFHFRAPVHRPDATRSAALLELVKASHAHDPAILEERAPFFWSAEISNSQIDFYGTHMLLSSLTNFAADARAGVGFQNSHRTREMSLGRSIDGRVETLDNRQRTVADFYTLPGLRLTEISTDDLIAGIRAGLVSDVSVGFGSWEKLSCDICGRDYFDWSCPHIPLMKYEVKGDDDVIRTVVSTFSVDGAHLFEVSAAYDGATPDATILKAERMAGAGLLKPETARILEQQYRVKLPGTNRAWAGYTEPEKGLDMDAQATLDSIRTNVTAAGYDGEDVPASVERILSDLEAARAAADKATALEAEAADGRSYRADLIAQALAEGVRAFGEGFDRAGYESDLKRAELSTIKRMLKDWAALAEQRFQAGRQSSENAENGKPRTVVSATPDSAYRV